MSASFVVRAFDEIYVYLRGRLVMKRWCKTGKSVVFETAPVERTRETYSDVSFYVNDVRLDTHADVTISQKGRS